MKNRITICLFFAVIVLLHNACVPPEYNREKYDGIAIDFADKQVQDIYNLLERQSADSLTRYLSHANPTYRYIAATAFGSLKEKKVVDSLARLLKDEFVDVRTAAAFSLGQIGDVRAEPLLLAGLRTSRHDGRVFKIQRGDSRSGGQMWFDWTISGFVQYYDLQNDRYRFARRADVRHF